MEVSQMDIVAAKHPGVAWRVFELECMEKYFGQSEEGRPEDINEMSIQRCGAKYVFWKLHTESSSEKLWQHCCRVAEGMSIHLGVKHINDPHGWLNCHAKEKAFEVWRREGIPCPDWFEFSNERTFFKNCIFDYPMLIRINNSTSGWFSYLCRNEAQVKEAIITLIKKQHYHHDGIECDGIGRKFIGVKFIPTTRPENLNMSFRIIVAGNKVITGYARLSPANDWIAITNRFDSSMEGPFVKYQKVCQDFIEKNESLIVASVKTLGLNFQGVDVILDQQDKPYFIEVQPGFSVGYPHRVSWKPPYYNPTKPEALVAFLRKNESALRNIIPMYVNLWLDKYNMFNKAFAALKEDLV